MKTLLFVLFVALTMGFSCNKSKNESFSIEWLVGAENGNVTKEITIPSKTDLKIEMTESSLCPNSGIELKLERDGEVFFDEVLTGFPDSKTLKISDSGRIKVITEVVGIPSEVTCIWLGNVKVILSY